MTNVFIHESSVVSGDAIIGKGSKIWHFCHVMHGVTLGEYCNIGQNVFIASGVTLGNNVKVQNNVSLYSGVCCDDDVFLGPSCVFTNVINPRSHVNRKNEYRTTYLRKGVSIGANATILCGIEIGEYALVGAGSVITKDVLPFALVVGNPAKQIGWISRDGFRLNFENGLAYCEEENRSYVLKGNQVEAT